MAPPKCFFKRPEEFYLNNNNGLSPKVESSATPSPPGNNFVLNDGTPPLFMKTEQSLCSGYNDYFHVKKSQQSTPIDSVTDPIETPLDLSCKYNAPEDTDILLKISSFIMQHQQQLARVNQTLASQNQYLHLERIFSQLPQQLYPSPSVYSAPNPKVYITPPPPISTEIDLSFSSNERMIDNRLHLSPHSVNESFRDRSSSDSSSHYTNSLQKNRTPKRKLDGKQLRPFKLYKGNDSQGLMEALGINSEDEEWLKSVIEYKSIDDVFLFLTNCMVESTRPIDLTDEIIDTIKKKFGHIFQNCNSTISNPKMVRHPDMTPQELKTDEYWEKRRKNNEAAKRSREARRNKEDTLNQHCEKLQAENEYLRKEIERVKLRIDDVKRSIS